MDKILFKVFPVQSKSYSGFFKVSNNTIPYTLILTDSKLNLKFLGIPFIRIDVDEIIGFKYIGDEWVTMQKVFNGVVIKYKRHNKIKERVITFLNKEQSSEFIKVIKKLTSNK